MILKIFAILGLLERTFVADRNGRERQCGVEIEIQIDVFRVRHEIFDFLGEQVR